jgi:hypothetical protein
MLGSGRRPMRTGRLADLGAWAWRRWPGAVPQARNGRLTISASVPAEVFASWENLRARWASGPCLAPWCSSYNAERCDRSETHADGWYDPPRGKMLQVLDQTGQVVRPERSRSWTTPCGELTAHGPARAGGREGDHHAEAGEAGAYSNRGQEAPPWDRRWPPTRGLVVGPSRARRAEWKGALSQLLPVLDGQRGREPYPRESRHRPRYLLLSLPIAVGIHMPSASAGREKVGPCFCGDGATPRASTTRPSTRGGVPDAQHHRGPEQPWAISVSPQQADAPRPWLRRPA